MQEVVGNLWTYPAGVRVILTNGFVKKNGECVMGRGCAKEAAIRWPFLPEMLGQQIKKHGNVPYHMILGGQRVMTFPTKHNWFEGADLKLIEESAKKLVKLVDDTLRDVEGLIVLPRPGCGNGGLKWEDVKPVIEPILDDRFRVITF